MEKEILISKEWDMFFEWCKQNGLKPSNGKVLRTYANATKQERK